jgi:hypothetical protein
MPAPTATSGIEWCLLDYEAIILPDCSKPFTVDKITETKDSVQRYDYLNTLFIDPGTPGLKAVMKARAYTAKSYIDAINQYPEFWNSAAPIPLKRTASQKR